MRTVAGRAGTNLIPLLNQGPEGLQKLNDVLDSTNSKLSPGMVEALAEAKRTSVEADAAWKGFYQTIGSTGFFDAVNHDLIDLAHAATNVANAIKHADKAFSDFITDSSDRVPTAAENFTAAANQFKMAMAGGGKGDAYGPPAPAPAAGNPLAALPTGTGAGTDDADKVQEQEDRSDYQTSLEIDKLKLQSRKDTDQAMVDSGKMSATQQIADLQQMAAQEYSLEVQAVNNLAGTYDEDSAEYAALQNKKLVLAQQFANEQAKLTEQLAAAQKKTYEEELAPWKSLMGDMGNAFDKMIDGVLMGTQTIGQAAAKAFDDMAVKFAEIMAKMTAEYLVFKATQNGAGTASGILGFGTTNPFAALGGAGGAAGGAGGAAQTASTTANTTALTALTTNLATLEAALGINTTTTATASSVTTAGTVATTANTTTTATTGAQGLLATIENTTSTLANTIALDAQKVASFIGSFLPSFDVGSYSVPSDMIAMIHQNEMIIPANQAQQIRSGSASLGASGGGMSGGGAPMNMTFQINAIDTQTGAQFLKNNAGVIAQTLAVSMRNGSNSLTNAMRG